MDSLQTQTTTRPTHSLGSIITILLVLITIGIGAYRTLHPLAGNNALESFDERRERIVEEVSKGSPTNVPEAQRIDIVNQVMKGPPNQSTTSTTNDEEETTVKTESNVNPDTEKRMQELIDSMNKSN